MGDKFRDDDPRTIWQNQAAEKSTMTLATIHQKARELRAKTRRQLLGAFTMPLVIALLYAFAIRQFRSLQEILHSLFAFAIVWSLCGVYLLNRGKWSDVMPVDAGFSAGLKFYQSEIERRRDYLRGALVWIFGPVILAIGTFILTLAMLAGGKIFLNAIPFEILSVGWAVAFLVIRAREQRDLRREIDVLQDIERENRRS